MYVFMFFPCFEFHYARHIRMKNDSFVNDMGFYVLICLQYVRSDLFLSVQEQEMSWIFRLLLTIFFLCII